MGLLTLIRTIKSEDQQRILFLGLDNAGKTTALKKIADEDVSNVEPTPGFNIKQVTYENLKINLWDIGGQKSLRTYWTNYYSGSSAVVFFVDSADEKRLQEAGTELGEALNDAELKGIPVLVFANKQDLENSQPAAKVAEVLQLDGTKDRAYHVQGCSAKTGEGLGEGLEWLVGKITAA